MRTSLRSFHNALPTKDNLSIDLGSTLDGAYFGMVVVYDVPFRAINFFVNFDVAHSR